MTDAIVPLLSTSLTNKVVEKTRKLIFHQLRQENAKEAFADYVLVIDSKIPSKEKEEFKTKLANTCKLVLANLEKAGLDCELRRSKEDMIFIFVLCSAERLKQEIYRSRVHDWLTGVRIRDIEDGHDSESDILLTEGERLRLVYDVITRSIKENGAGINPGLGEFKLVNSLLPIHNKEYNQTWIKSWSMKWVIDRNDLMLLRDHFGEKIAFYFAFLQYYCLWLIAPTIAGLFTYFFLSDYSILLAIFIVVWSVIFTEFWRRKERELSIWWGVRNFSRVEQRRPEFQEEFYVVNHITGELDPYFPLWKRWLRRIIAAPVIMAFSLILAAALLFYIVLEVTISEYYTGPFREQVIYLPTILYCALVPALNIVYVKIARRLNDYENNETESYHEFSLTQKIFVANFLVGYLSIFFIGWIYIPFNAEIGEFFQSIFDALGLSLTLKPVGPERLKNELKYFILTGQGISLFVELILPYMTRGLAKGVHKTISTGSKILHRQNSLSVDARNEDEEEFLRRVRREVLLPVYDIYEDYAEMITQYGYVSLFSVVWPLTPVLALLNNWVELRSDAIKICVHTRRPVPSRADSIGPWLDNLALITWLSSITNPTFVYLYHPNSTAFTSPSAVLVTVALIWFSEHILSVLQLIIRQCLSAFPSWADELILKEEYELKKKWLEKVEIPPVAPPEHSVQEIIDNREEKGSWFWRNEKRQDINERLAEIFQGLHLD
ncbi:14408_t:CDS:2 [Ambispora leptoticha]|uniref:14408_t:CDS:1 n=1 Tax=Ambispora leptoticha TaxID=144679 RepID=A0A9N8VW93_9GLOM|nr:14408_t:CDS:2 [Ambispora leptoticha]